jgi:SAM-dependent methyltransferase
MITGAPALREEVRQRYAEAARRATDGETCGCGSTCCSEGERSEGCCGEECCGGGAPGDFGQVLYSDEERGELPEAAARASLGCGSPTAVAELGEGQVVLDLGSGGGVDVILSARRVGPTGLAYGLDMTDEMLALARQNAREAGVDNVVFLKGVIEDVPLPAESVDVVISNCVINLSTDKAAVLAEMSRVLKPGGRIGVSDVVAEDRLNPEERAERGRYVGCIAGALSKMEYESGLQSAGFTEICVSFTHEVADGMHAATVQATKPTPSTKPLPLIASGSDSACC